MHFKIGFHRERERRRRGEWEREGEGKREGERERGRGKERERGKGSTNARGRGRERERCSVKNQSVWQKTSKGVSNTDQRTEFNLERDRQRRLDQPTVLETGRGRLDQPVVLGGYCSHRETIGSD